jgi:uncharacterized membrane protein
VLAYAGLSAFPPGLVAILVLVFVALRVAVGDRMAMGNAFRATTAIGGCCILALLLVDGELAVRAYPVAMSLGLAAVFGASLIRRPTIIERIARLRTPDLSDRGRRYTANVTIVWLIFFVANATASLWTAAAATRETWLLYNGLISYILIAALLAVEWTIRGFVMARDR